ncbi:hypothetical protein OF829_00760 [Sphingomonas sp. LB-2]|uniref:DUF2243 domain-containing protein n=1 Tax=Sphingomonas caeni TaxID=2984949 RepID=UPI0022322A65|nr:DUF2243 domain-containing protein [Sphingomonas caeni]MCW3845751.1 hypothetical protein [Sphingomonas caeni]
MSSTSQKIVTATLIAGTLDIAMAITETLMKGKDPLGMLAGIASGPIPGAGTWGLAGSAIGLLVHFAIMAVIATVFILVRERSALIRNHTLLAAALYGVGVWAVMYGVVLHQRFGVPFPAADSFAIAKQLFAHVVLVGLPIGWVAKRG